MNTKKHYSFSKERKRFLSFFLAVTMIFTSVASTTIGIYADEVLPQQTEIEERAAETEGADISSAKPVIDTAEGDMPAADDQADDASGAPAAIHSPNLHHNDEKR